jgi:hypothetical protein
MDGNSFSEVARFITNNPPVVAFIIVSIVSTFLFAIFEPRPKTVYFPMVFGMVAGLLAAVIAALVMLIIDSPVAASVVAGILLIFVSSVVGHFVGKWRDRHYG